MLASKTSHKRRRSSARGDASRRAVGEPRAIVTIAGSRKEKERECEKDASWSWKRLEKIVASHPINHCLQIQIPITSLAELEEVCKVLPSTSRAYAVKIPLCLFLDPIFITSHIKRGHLIALSKGRLDTDDVFCLDGHGVLYLSLTRDSYQTLGLVGQALKQSRISSGKGRDRLSGKVERWMVCIDLLAPSFVPGKPGFDRTLARLREWDERRSKKNSDENPSWDTLFCWTDEGSEGGAEMHFPPRHVKQEDKVEIQVRPKISSLDDCWAPLQSNVWNLGWKTEGEEGNGRMDWDAWCEDLDTLFEWSGLASMSSESLRTFSRSDHLNSYQVGTIESRQSTSLVQVRYQGLLSSVFCASIIASVRSYLLAKTNGTNLGLAIITCSGFADSPLAWKMNDTSTLSSEENNLLQGTSEDSEEDKLESKQETGPKARKQRQKKRQKRGTTSPHQVGHQVKVPGSSNHNGWQLVLLNDNNKHTDAATADYILVENVGGCLKC